VSWECANAPVERLARMLVRAAMSDQPDVESVDALSLVAGLSRRCLQYRCSAAGVAARDCVHLVQCLKSLWNSDDVSWDPAALLPICDPRTLRRVLRRGSFTPDRRPDIKEFILSQQFCGSPSLRRALLRECERQRTTR